MLNVSMDFLRHTVLKHLELIACADDQKSRYVNSAIGLYLVYEDLSFDIRTVTYSPIPTVNGTYRTMNHAGGANFRINL
jgi:hypothetical protein